MDKFRFLTAALLIVAILPVSLSAGIDDDDDDFKWKRWKRQHHGFFNGFGSFMINYQMFSGSDLNDLADAMGVKRLDEGIYTFGGRGMGHVGKGWYIGGGGFGGEAASSGIREVDGVTLNTEMSMSFGGGGFMFEWAPLNVGPVNIGAGSMLGGGGVTVKVIQNTGNLSWDCLTDSFRDDPSGDCPNFEYNGVVELLNGFYWARPYVTVRVRVLDWLALEGAAGMNLTTLDKSDWEFHEKELSGEGPDLNINEPFFRFGLLFGG